MAETPQAARMTAPEPVARVGVEAADRQIVEAAYPAARIVKKGLSYFVMARTRNGTTMTDHLLGHGRMNQDSAWADAAKKIQDAD